MFSFGNEEMVKKLDQNVALVTAEGKLMGGPETAHLCKEVEELERAGYKRIVLDLSRVRWATSTAIGALIRSFLSLRNQGTELRFACPSERLRYYMTITKLIQVIPTFDSLDEAITAPAPG